MVKSRSMRASWSSSTISMNSFEPIGRDAIKNLPVPPPGRVEGGAA
jgi:hypothetical protein